MAQQQFPTIYLHGFAHTSAQWQAVASLAAPASALFVRLPFHEAPAVPSLSAAHEALWQQVAAAGHVGPVVLCGYSLGARLALGMALGAPARVAGLVLVSGHVGLMSAAERAARAQADAAWQRRLRREPLAAVLAAFRAQPVFAPPTAHPAQLEPAERASQLARAAQRARETLCGPRLAASFDVLGLAAMPCALAELARLPLPAHWLVGERDGKFCRLARLALRAQPGLTVRTVPGAFHDLLWDAPRDVARAVRALQIRK